MTNLYLRLCFSTVGVTEVSDYEEFITTVPYGATIGELVNLHRELFETTFLKEWQDMVASAETKAPNIWWHFEPSRIVVIWKDVVCTSSFVPQNGNKLGIYYQCSPEQFKFFKEVALKKNQNMYS